MDSKMKSKMENEMGTVIIWPFIGIRASKKQGFRFKIKDYNFRCLYRGPPIARERVWLRDCSLGGLWASQHGNSLRDPSGHMES